MVLDLGNILWKFKLDMHIFLNYAGIRAENTRKLDWVMQNVLLSEYVYIHTDKS